MGIALPAPWVEVSESFTIGASCQVRIQLGGCITHQLGSAPSSEDRNQLYAQLGSLCLCIGGDDSATTCWILVGAGPVNHQLANSVAGWASLGYTVVGTIDASTITGPTWSPWYSYSYSFGPARLGESVSSAGGYPRLAQGDQVLYHWFADGYTQISESLAGVSVSRWVDGNYDGSQNPAAVPADVGTTPGTFTYGGGLDTNTTYGGLEMLQFQDLTYAGQPVDTSDLKLGATTGPYEFCLVGTGAGAASLRAANGISLDSGLSDEINPPYIITINANVTKFRTLGSLDAADMGAWALFAPFTTKQYKNDGVTVRTPYVGDGGHWTTPQHVGTPLVFPNYPLSSRDSSIFKWDGLVQMSLDPAWMSSQSPTVDSYLSTMLMQCAPPTGNPSAVTPWRPGTLAINGKCDIERPLRGGSARQPSNWVAGDGNVTVTEHTANTQFVVNASGSATTITRTLATNWQRAIVNTDGTIYKQYVSDDGDPPSYTLVPGTGPYDWQFDSAYEGTQDANPGTYFSQAQLTAIGVPSWWVQYPDVSCWRLWAHLRLHLDCPADMPANTQIRLKIAWKGVVAYDSHVTGLERNLDQTIAFVSHTNTYKVTVQPGVSPSDGYDVDLMYPTEGGPIRVDRVTSLTLSGLWGEASGATYTLNAAYLTGVNPAYLTLAFGAPRVREETPDSDDPLAGALVAYHNQTVKWPALHLTLDGAAGSYQGDTIYKDDMLAVDGTGGDPRYVEPLTGVNTGTILDSQLTAQQFLAKLGQLEGMTLSYPLPETALQDSYGNTLGPTPIAQWLQPIAPYDVFTQNTGTGQQTYNVAAFVRAGTMQIAAGIPFQLLCVWPLGGGIEGEISSQTTGARMLPTDPAVSAFAFDPDAGAELGSGVSDSQGYVPPIPTTADGNYPVPTETNLSPPDTRARRTMAVRTTAGHQQSKRAAVRLRALQALLFDVSAPVQKPGSCLEIASERGWLHAGQGNQIATYHLHDYSLAFLSAPYAVDSWVRFNHEPRRGSLNLLGKSGSNIVVYHSEDGGQTGSLVMSIAANTGSLERESERGNLFLVYGDASDAVWVQTSQDGGLSYSAAQPVNVGGSQLVAKVLDTAQDPRRALLTMLAQVGSDTNVYASQDGGLTFVQVV